MNRSTTKLLGVVTTVFTVGLFLLMFFGNSVFSLINKIAGRNIITPGLSILLIPLGVVGVLAVLILGIIVNYSRKNHRREDLKKFAQQNSWTYTEKTDLSFLKEFDSLLNDSRLSNSNVLTGSSSNVLMGAANGRNFLVSDQTYTTGSINSSHRTTYQKTLAGIELNEAKLPLMCLYPEGFMDKVFDNFSKFDIDFPSHPHFSQKYVLYGRNADEIRAFFDTRILAFYEQQPLFSTVCGGKYLLIWSDVLLDSGQITQQLNLLFMLANLFLKK